MSDLLGSSNRTLSEDRMRSRVLVALLGCYVLVAVTPGLIWLTAVVFEGIDDSLRDALSLTAFTVPIALGAAAVTLAMHGLKVNAEVHAAVTEDLDDLRHAVAHPAGVAVPVMAGADSVDDGGSTAEDRTARTARVGAPPKGKGDRTKRRAKGLARAQLRRRVGF